MTKQPSDWWYVWGPMVKLGFGLAAAWLANWYLTGVEGLSQRDAGLVFIGAFAVLGAGAAIDARSEARRLREEFRRFVDLYSRDREEGRLR